MTDTVFAAARTDWSRRGGRTMTGATDPIDALGGNLGLGATVASSAGGPGLALLAEFRLADHRDAAPVPRTGAPVPRAGLGIAAGAELALPAPRSPSACASSRA